MNLWKSIHRNLKILSPQELLELFQDILLYPEWEELSRKEKKIINEFYNRVYEEILLRMK